MPEDEKVIDAESIEEMIDLDVKTKFKSKVSSDYNTKFSKLHMKHKKDKKKIFVVVAALLMVLSIFFSSSYAYLTYVSSTNNSTTINAGTIAVTLEEKENSLTLLNSFPVSDTYGMNNSKEYNFTVKNTGNISSIYKLIITNSCKVGEIYKINDKNIKADKCLLDQYIKIGIKLNGAGEYKVISKTDEESYIIDSQSLESNQSISYSMKLWLDENTPNIFNGKDGNVIFIGHLGVEYEQTV